jgi:hypothetical protein
MLVLSVWSVLSCWSAGRVAGGVMFGLLGAVFGLCVLLLHDPADGCSVGVGRPGRWQVEVEVGRSADIEATSAPPSRPTVSDPLRRDGGGTGENRPDQLMETIMITSVAVVAHEDLPTAVASPAPRRSCVGRHNVVGVAVVAVLVVGAVLGLAMTEPAAFALLGSYGGIGLIVVMAGVPVLLELQDHRAAGRALRGH